MSEPNQLRAVCDWNRRLVSENARLRRENQRLANENASLGAQAEASEALLDSAMREASRARYR